MIDAAAYNTILALAAIGALFVAFMLWWFVGTALACVWWFATGVVNFTRSLRKVRS